MSNKRTNSQLADPVRAVLKASCTGNIGLAKGAVWPAADAAGCANSVMIAFVFAAAVCALSSALLFASSGCLSLPLSLPLSLSFFVAFSVSSLPYLSLSLHLRPFFVVCFVSNAVFASLFRSLVLQAALSPSPNPLQCLSCPSLFPSSPPFPSPSPCLLCPFHPCLGVWSCGACCVVAADCAGDREHCDEPCVH